MWRFAPPSSALSLLGGTEGYALRGYGAVLRPAPCGKGSRYSQRDRQQPPEHRGERWNYRLVPICVSLPGPLSPQHPAQDYKHEPERKGSISIADGHGANKQKPERYHHEYHFLS